MAMELSHKRWKLAFSDGAKRRMVEISGGDQRGVREAVEKAKKHFGLEAGVEVRSCYEAGRDGFWIHRFLRKEGIQNVVVDAGSIEVARRARRVKTDRLDAMQLVEKLMREPGCREKKWSEVRVPSEAEEDQRRGHRELERLKKERTGHRNRIRSLLVLQGIRGFPRRPYGEWLTKARPWDEQPLPGTLRQELERECARLSLVEEQIRAVQGQHREALKDPETPAEKKAQKLKRLRSVGAGTSRTLAMEFFGWREFRNRREVGALSGLVGTPYDSGDSRREQGISKAGNRRVRWGMIELAWGWLRWQPQSELSRWYQRRFGHGSPRMRRVGIVALARKLLVALWKYVERDEVPAGAVMKTA
jgi:transposase